MVELASLPGICGLRRKVRLGSMWRALLSEAAEEAAHCQITFFLTPGSKNSNDKRKQHDGVAALFPLR